MQCLECGQWYRNLGIHLSLKHEISPDDYRRDHELAAGRGLVSADLSELLAQRQRQRMDADPAFRAALAEGSRRLGAHDQARRRARRASDGRAGVQRAWQASALAASEVRAARTRAASDALAERHGHPSMLALLQATTELTARELAEWIGLSALQVRKLRTRYGVRSLSRQPRAARQDADRNAELAAVPAGIQPVDATRGMQCLECGRWSRKLSVHLTRAHHVTPQNYLDRHVLTAAQSPWLGLRPKPPTRVPTDAEREARRDALRLSVAHANAAKSAQARARHDARARELGYTDLRDLLESTRQLRQRDIAPMLGVSTASVGRMRAGSAQL